MPLGHLLHDNYQTRQFNIRSGQYAIISEKDIPPFGSVSVVSKVLLPHRNNIPKPKLSTWKLVSPVVRKSFLKLAFEVKHPKKIMKMCMHQNFSNSFLVARLKCMLIGGHKDIFSSISVWASNYLDRTLVQENLCIYIAQFTNRKWVFLTTGPTLTFKFLLVCDGYK